MRKLLYALVFLCLFCHVEMVRAQMSYNVPIRNSQTITTCEATIFDPGGRNNYSVNCNGYLIVRPDAPGCVLHLEGSYDTETWDLIYVYDGEGLDGAVLVDGYSGQGYINVTSSTGALTIRFTSDSHGTHPGFEFSTNCVGGCACGASPTNVIFQLDNGGALVTWDESVDSSVSAYILEYGPAGFVPGTGTTVRVQENACLLTGLTVGDTYDVYLYFDCGNDGVVTTETATIASFCMPSGSNCLDFSDLNNPNITCYYGDYHSPYASVGIVDFGPQSMMSRHTIHVNDEMDPRTNHLLHTIPPCEFYSVRLGNWNVGHQAESVTYDYFVDTTESSILLLKYAAVLEDPNHVPEEQPRFKFELLDQFGQVVDPTCGSADYIANADLGWNDGQPGVLWKDWTTVGTDLSAYHGQTVRIRLTTFDCDHDRHFGYAYFNLNCQRKVLLLENCGESSLSTFTAPSGFAYRWYYQNHPEDTLSTAQTLTVDNQGIVETLCCQVISLNNDSCYFTLSTLVAPRFPVAGFTANRDECSSRFLFHNTSFVSSDGTPAGDAGERCEYVYWDFGDGTTSNDFEPTHYYEEPGVYEVMLVAGMGHGACRDTVYQLIDIPLNDPAIVGPELICGGELVTLTAHHGGQFTWLIDTQEIGYGSSITVVPRTTTTYTLISITSDGCQKTVTHTIEVHNRVETVLVAEICQGEEYCRNGFLLPAQHVAGHFTRQLHLQTIFGCDSVVTLELTVRPTAQVDEQVTVCDSELPYLWHGQLCEEAGTYEWRGQTIHGCDSVVRLVLGVSQSFTTTEVATVCNNELPYLWHGQQCTQSGRYTWHGQTVHGCDSIVTLTLVVNPTTSASERVVVCDNALPYTWHGQLCEEAGTYAWTGRTVDGCDSMVTLTLVVNNVAHRIEEQSVCDVDLPYEWHGQMLSAGGSYNWTTTAVNGCDSVVTLELTVRPTAQVDEQVTVCDSELPYLWHGQQCDMAGTYEWRGQTIHGCDSVVRLILGVSQSYTTEEAVTVCNNELPYLWHEQLCEAAGRYVWRGQTAHGCDSIVTLTLVVNPTTSASERVVVCDNALPYTWHGMVCATPGSYVWTGLTADGCDSLVTLTLVVNNVAHRIEEQSVCDVDLPYEWHGQALAVSGTYNWTTTAVNGCDSVVTLELTVRPTVQVDEQVTVCDSELPYLWHGQQCDMAGTYEWRGQTIHGCDSVVILELQVLTSVHSEEELEICETELPFEWHDQLCLQEGLYEWHGQSINGCDSLVSMTLVVSMAVQTEEHVSVCQDELPYEWHGQSFVQTGRYLWLGQGTNGCDSVVTLDLVVGTIPDVDLGVDFDHCFDRMGGVELVVKESDCDSYLWNTGETTQSIMVQTEGTYSVTVRKNNCEKYDEITIENVCPLALYLPNAITPSNRDGINDYFELSSTEQIEKFSIHIYNRFGEVVFYSEDPGFQWDGSCRGQLFTNVVYSYIVFCSNKQGRQFVFKGSLTVL